MENLPFVLWMLGWPLIKTIDRYLNPDKKEYSDNVVFWGAFIWLMVYVLVANYLMHG